MRKWRKRTTTADAPKAPKSTVLTPAEEAIVMAFRQKTLLSLDDVLGGLRDTIPGLSRSALHRCLQRHGISRLPVDQGAAQAVQDLQIGHVHIDSSELRHADGKLIMFLAIDRVSNSPTSSSTTALGRSKARPSWSTTTTTRKASRPMS